MSDAIRHALPESIMKTSAKNIRPNAVDPIEMVPEEPFYIHSTEPTTRPRRTLKHGDTFVVLDSHGDIGASAGGTDGLFHDDTRFLSRLSFSLNDEHPLLLGSNVRDDNTLFTIDLTNPDLYVGDQLTLPKDTVHVVRTVFVWRESLHQRLAVRNYGDCPIDVSLAFTFDGDFADLFEVRGLRRERRGHVGRHFRKPNRAVISYRGLDHKLRRTVIAFDPEPTTLNPKSACYRFSLEPGETKSIFLNCNCNHEGEPKPAAFLRDLHAARNELRRSTHNAATVVTNNEIFNEVLCRSMSDLCMLVTVTPEGPYPYAGIPWYNTTFGRDGIVTALQMLWFQPNVARGVLRRLAAYQAKVEDAPSDAQPGKILHEMRCGEMATLREVPFGLYYGSVDATPLFVLLAGRYAERTGDYQTVAELWPAIEAALAWTDGPGDPDQDGFVEYRRATDEGLANQGWKDSHDAIFHADGRLAEGRIALAEVQGYVYAAKTIAARLARHFGMADKAQKLESEAALLASRFEATFWCPELGTYALALDGAKEPCRVHTSNAGQVLFAGICAPERAAEIADGLMRPQFFSGWGIRTVAQGESRYNPMSYHNGSIWPHDNALIALGFARYGLKQPVERVFHGLFDAAAYMDLRRLPELFCGFRRTRGRGPTLYPVACNPQAWASATPFSLLEASLGLEFDPAAGEIRLRNPRLPRFLDEVVLHNLQLGQASVDLRVHRRDEEVSVELLQTSGKIQVSAVFSR
jgi:glycogen debranching enzyme